MMLPQLDIYNMALTMVGSNPLLSLNENNIRSTVLNLNFNTTVNGLLEDVDWSFAMRRVVLDTPSVTPPEWGGMYVFDLPDDCIRARRLFSDISALRLVPSQDWSVENNQLLTHFTPAYLQYISNAVNHEDTSPLFTKALALKLASDICVPLTKNTQLKQDLLREHTLTLKDAIVADGRQGGDERIRKGGLIGARMGGSPWYGR
jgi:hypothetical protein